MKKKLLSAVIAVAALIGTTVSTIPAHAATTTVSIDYANWNPLSLVIKNQGWLDADLKKQGATLNWVYSAGSAAAIQNLNANAIQLGSSAGVAAFVARSNGVPIKTIGVFSQPNWAAIVVGKNSTLTSPAQLKGKKIAAQKGTDPYFFLLQTLAKFKLDPVKDVTIVNLAHADGRAALVRGDVDAWSGLDPITAQSVKIDSSKIIYQNPRFNTYGVLSAREDFIASSPKIIKTVLANYQKARQWVKDNQDAAVKILSDSAKIDLDVARTVLLERTKLAVNITPGQNQQGVLQGILPVLVADAQVTSLETAQKALASLYDTTLSTNIFTK